LVNPYFEIKTTFLRSAGDEQQRDHAHVYGLKLEGDGELAMRFRPEHRHQHSEASLTVRVDETNWVKTSAEYLGGQHLVSTVTTRNHTDWSLSPVESESDEIWLRLIRNGGTVTWLTDGQAHPLTVTVTQGNAVRVYTVQVTKAGG